MLLIAIFVPPLLALLLAVIQDLFYKGLVKLGRIKDEDRPFFGILLFRGLLVGLAVILSMTIIIKKDVPLEKDPLLSEEQQRQIERMKAGESPIPSDNQPTEATDQTVDTIEEVAPEQAMTEATSQESDVAPELAPELAPDLAD